MLTTRNTNRRPSEGARADHCSCVPELGQAAGGVEGPTTSTVKGRFTGRMPTLRGAVAICVAAFLAGCTPPGPKALLDGERLMQEGKPKDAVPKLRTAVELLPSNAQAWNHLGLALHASRQPADAAEAYKQALRVDRNLAVVHFNLGCLWSEQGDPARAVDSLRAYVGLSPRSFEGWLKLGQAQLRLRQWDQADQSFSGALRLSPRDAEALNGLGVSQQQRRRSRDAWQSFTNAIGQNPRFAPAWLNLAIVAQQAGARPQAIQAYRKFAELRPDAIQSLGLERVIQQLESANRPAFQLPTRTDTLPEAPHPTAPTNHPAAPTSGNHAAASPTNPPPAIPILPVHPPSQPRSPPRHADASPTNPTNPTIAVRAAPSTTAVAPPPGPNPTPQPDTASPPRDLAAVSTPPPAVVAPPPSPSPTSTVAVAVAIVVPAPASAPVPRESTSSTPTPALPPPSPLTNVVLSTPAPTPEPTPPPEPAPTPVELVQLVTPPVIAQELRDEPGPTPTQPATTPIQPVTIPANVAAAATTKTGVPPAIASAPSQTATTQPPLIRPIPAQRPAPPQEKPGFWSRANPTKWFSSDKDATSAGTEPASTESPPADGSADDERNRWRWANPMTWFRPGENKSAGGSSDAPLATQVEPSPIPSMPAPGSVTNAPAPAPTPTPTPTPRAPVQVAMVPDVPRYRYMQPSAPAVGDTATAAPVVARALEEHRQGRLASALRLYGEAVKIDPSSFDSQHNMAAALLQSGDSRSALATAETALALRPGSIPARLNFALALDNAGYPADAAVEASRIAAEKEGNAGGSKSERVAAHLLLGNLYAQKLGQPDRAREHYLKVLDLEPEHPQNVAIRRWLVGRR